MWRRRRDLAAVRGLVEEIKHSEPERREATEALLRDRYGYLEAPLEKWVQDIHHAERSFYQSILTLYLQRDPKRLRQLKEPVEELTALYRSLAIQQVVPMAATAVPPAADAAEFDRLLRENQKLSIELQSTMEVMARMLSDYASLFASQASNVDSQDPAAMAAFDTMAPENRDSQGETANRMDSLLDVDQEKVPGAPDDTVELDENAAMFGDFAHLFPGTEKMSEQGLGGLSEDVVDLGEDDGANPEVSDVSGNGLGDFDLLGDLEALAMDVNQEDPDFDASATVVTKH
ncbi:MAG: hypothetical protein WCP34_04740 [Pseudomonadota bacterium]